MSPEQTSHHSKTIAISLFLIVLSGKYLYDKMTHKVHKGLAFFYSDVTIGIMMYFCFQLFRMSKAKAE